MTGGPLVLTLDAGGTTFAFSAVRDGREATAPVVLPAMGDDLHVCLGQLRKGFEAVHGATGRQASAISFAFPGPADYPRGVIGDLKNLPGFRGGVALGPMLEDHFQLPVFLNNDGDLFAYGEALAGRLPEVNAELEAAGSPFRHRHLLGLTIGTGFGAGIVAEGRLLRGDNSAAGEIWLVRSKTCPACFAEEGVSIAAVRSVYAKLSGLDAPEPKALADIARGSSPGNPAAAREAFRALGEAAGDAVANALTLVDGLVVIGGGLAGAADLFLPALMAELNGTLATRSGGTVGRLESKAYNLEDAGEKAAFLKGEAREVMVPGSTRRVAYDPLKRVGVCISRLGAAKAVALGGWAYAVDRLDARDRR
ncbi:MAG TPA: ROK family protein [Holophagaceae bacterium]|jgi:glucokinase|nr:ROK family protein [Holophagaceae bacterium]